MADRGTLSGSCGPSTDVYLSCMSELRDRLNAVMLLSTEPGPPGIPPLFVLESQFLQLRKALELIAFGSLTANQEKYAAVHQRFASHWKAEAMLSELERINPHFYPVPLFVRKVIPAAGSGQQWQYQVKADGFLNREEFAFLYDVAGTLAHARNPFHPSQTVEIKYDTPVWVERFRSLIRIHSMHFVDDCRWLVYVPDAGPLQVLTVNADPSVLARALASEGSSADAG